MEKRGRDGCRKMLGSMGELGVGMGSIWVRVRDGGEMGAVRAVWAVWAEWVNWG